MSLHKCESLHVRFGGDISVRSIIYPMEWPFCFCGSTNINVLLNVHDKGIRKKYLVGLGLYASNFFNLYMNCTEILFKRTWFV